MIPALVLAAGLGTRARPLTLLRAKAALPVAGQPLIVRILRWLARSGVDDVVVNLHHRPETITAVLGDGSDLGLRIRYSWEQPVALGRAGGPRHALALLGTSPFLLVNGDTLTDIDPRLVIDRHRSSGARVTLALVPNTAPEHYGGAIVDSAGYVTGFVRRGRAAVGSYHFIGVQVASAEVFAGLDDGQPVNSIGGCYDALLRDNPHSIAAYVSDAAFWDIGTPGDYLATSLALADGTASTALVGRNVSVDASATIVDSVIWDDVTIGPGCLLNRCIVTDGAHVGPNSRYESLIVIHGPDAIVTVPLEAQLVRE